MTGLLIPTHRPSWPLTAFWLLVLAVVCLSMLSCISPQAQQAIQTIHDNSAVTNAQDKADAAQVKADAEIKLLKSKLAAAQTKADAATQPSSHPVEYLNTQAVEDGKAYSLWIWIGIFGTGIGVVCFAIAEFDAELKVLMDGIWHIALPGGLGALSYGWGGKIAVAYGKLIGWAALAAFIIVLVFIIYERWVWIKSFFTGAAVPAKPAPASKPVIGLVDGPPAGQVP